MKKRNLIWISGDGKFFYYAHLEEHLVGLGRVSAGEPIRRVGNSGNARTTLPYLHFGLYDGGPVDPASQLASPGTPPSVTADRDILGRPARVVPLQALLRSGPSTSYEIRDELPRRTAGHAEAANADCYRIRLAAGRHGYMSGSPHPPISPYSYYCTAVHRRNLSNPSNLCNFLALALDTLAR